MLSFSWKYPICNLDKCHALTGDFQEFDDDRDAREAVDELDGKDLLGDRIVVEIARGEQTRRY